MFLKTSKNSLHLLINFLLERCSTRKFNKKVKIVLKNTGHQVLKAEPLTCSSNHVFCTFKKVATSKHLWGTLWIYCFLLQKINLSCPNFKIIVRDSTLIFAINIPEVSSKSQDIKKHRSVRILLISVSLASCIEGIV